MRKTWMAVLVFACMVMVAGFALEAMAQDEAAAPAAGEGAAMELSKDAQDAEAEEAKKGGGMGLFTVIASSGWALRSKFAILRLEHRNPRTHGVEFIALRRVGESSVLVVA